MDEPPLAPSDFYTGLVAQLYSPLRAYPVSPDPYRDFVQRTGQPALELGCGDGDPMLQLVAEGLDVHGLDSSLDLLDRCRAAATAQGLDVTLHHATFENMDLGQQFPSIYFAGPTFNLLPDDDSARQALSRIAHHLLPGGAALIPLFIPEPTHVGAIGRRTEHTDESGTVLSVTVTSAERDEAARRQTIGLRYESVSSETTESVDRDWVLHWIDRERFAATAAEVGLTAELLDGDETDATEFTFLLTKPA